LRNPLAPVRSALEILRRGGPDKVRWATDLMDRQVQSLGRLIDDLMDVSRISRGRIELRREIIAINDALVDAVEAVRPMVEEAGHELAVLLPDRQLVVDGDRTRLAQVFTNLLSNSVKYTERGGRIEIGVMVEREMAVVTIRDNGIGIPPDRLESVFEMFSQVEAALERSRGGLGIGLALTRQLVQMHGGSVRAYSDGPGHGSRFQVFLPLAATGAAASQQPAPSATQSTQAGMRILVADDNVDAAATLATLLEMMDHEVRHVHDGEAALAESGSFDPHLLLLDIGMPKINGYDVCRSLRAQEHGRRRTIVAVTGWGQPQDVQRSRDAGFDHHLVKPIDIDKLTALIDELPRTPAATARVEPAQRRQDPKR
jgi:CheY-like chemotaxis protein